MDDQEIIREFLIESTENLNRLDEEIVDLESRPSADRLASIFRTLHTIKGTCGFLGFSTLERITHHAENILSQFRSGQRIVSKESVSLILETADAVRKILLDIEKSGGEGSGNYDALVSRLESFELNGGDQRGAATRPSHALTGEAEGPESERVASVCDTTVRVDVGLLDRLMNLIGELVLARNQVLQCSNERGDPPLNSAAQRLNVITAELQESVMKTRMQPVALIWKRLPRIVRDLAHSLGKQIELEMEGAATELDKTIVEALQDPVLHLVRNACDHGFENPAERTKRGKRAHGTLCLKAFHQGGQVHLEVSDDGAGIDVERIRKKAVERGLVPADVANALGERESLNLLFLPGLSTAAAVTNVSGRGVGMDVVKCNIERIGGSVEISTHLCHRTTVTLKMPLTLAIIPGLLIGSGGQRFVIPQTSLLEVIRLQREAMGRIENIQGALIYRHRGMLLPLADLNRLLGLEPGRREDGIYVAVLQSEDRQFGLIVEAIHDTQEIVVKPLGKQFKGMRIYAGAAIAGDGTLALILDASGLAELASVSDRNRRTVVKDAPTRPRRETQRFLLFRAGVYERLAVRLSFVTRLEEFPQASIEHFAGRHLVQYQKRILPILSIELLINGLGELGSLARDPVQVIVFEKDDQRVGLAVDGVMDIVEDEKDGSASVQSGVMAPVVISNKIADLLSADALFQAAGNVERQIAGITGASRRELEEDAIFSDQQTSTKSLENLSRPFVTDERSAVEAKP